MRPFIIFIILILFASAAGGFFVLKQEKEIVIDNVQPALEANVTSPISGGSTSETLDREVEPQNISEKTILSLIEKAKEKSDGIKGVYAGRAGNYNYLKQLLDGTELNGVVIDIKESYGINLPISFKNLILKLHEDDNWVIARIVLFRDSSLAQDKPEWYLASTTDATTTAMMPWQDKAGQYWFDPQKSEVQDYIINFSKKAIDYGFDELQFDYIRYPDDYADISGGDKIKVIGNFFSKLSQELRSYKPQIILSVDLFGYVATQFNSYGTGQRLIDAAKYFDYLSFMLYPSHFYGGFSAPEDLKRQISSAYFPYKDDNTTSTGHLAPNNPYDIISRSIFSSLDYLDLYGIKTKIRPWLQDFDLKADTSRGIFYDAQKVRLEISAAEDAGSSGWLLWNPSYIYTKEALKAE